MLASTDLGLTLEETYGLDPMFRLRGPLEPPADVVVVRRDSETYSWLQRLPKSPAAWPAPLASCVARYPELAGLRGIDTAAPPPRTLYACVVDLLREAGATTIVFDVAFQRRLGQADETRALAAAMRAHGRVLLSERVDDDQPTRSDPGVLAAATAVEPSDRVLLDAAAGAATFLMPNPDGTRFARQFWTRHAAMPQPLQLPALALELSMSEPIEHLARRLGWQGDPDAPWLQRNRQAVAAILGAAGGGREPVAGDDPLYPAWQRLQRTRRGSDYLYFNLYGPPGTVRSVSFAALLGDRRAQTGADTRGLLHGATAFVGYAELRDSQKADDHYPTAFTHGSVQLSGVELGATAFANLRDGNAIRALPDYERLPLSFAIGGSIAAGAAAGTLWFGFALAASITLAWVAVAVVAFVVFGWWLPVVLPVAVLFAAALCGAVWRSHVLGDVVSRHFPGWISTVLLGGDREDADEGERPIVVLFTDMVGSTRHTEALEARGQAVVDAFRERHFEILDGAILAQGGDLYSFTGDGRQAGWGYPERRDDDAIRACKAALAIEAALTADNAAREARGDLPVRVRIGLHAGPGRVIVIGRPPGVTFALTGNTVNAASKVEQIGKTLVADQPVATILATGAVVAQTGDVFDWESQGEHNLGGRREVTRLFRLRGLRRAAMAASLLLLAAFAGPRADAAEPCPADRPAVAWIVAEEGNVLVAQRRVRAGFEPAIVCADDIVDVGPDSRATLTLLGSNTTASLDHNSIVRLPAPPEPESGVMRLVRGTLFFISQVRRRLTIETAYSNAGIVGTEVLVAVGEGDEPRLDLRVFEGAVAMCPAAGPLAVSGLPDRPVVSGERLVVGDDLVARLEQPVEADAVQLRAAAARALSWTLYYPPLFPPGAAVSPPLREASRLLAAGQADAARAVLQRVGDGSADAGLRDALLAVVAVTQGDPQAGLTLAETAVRRRPDAAAPLLARSFAEQALRRLDDARASARAATEVEPGDALAWARLAEVELMFGATRASRGAADRAVELGPTALVRVVQGFARLAAFDIDGARASFAAALDLDSGQPLAHLGLGLASIRRNEMEAGTRSLEIAAGLDPAQSLLRSYLGKAYFTDFRDKAAARQYEIAKQLDPSDPTPWLYDAIRKQLDNRPVEALRDLETSIALNDNRATFRSGLLLDEDRAVRRADLGRIYQDLGFEAQGRSEAAKAVLADPTSGAAYRLMADLAQSGPRQEVSRASDLLRSQLLTPPSLGMLQPGLAFNNLDLLRDNGPARVAFQEFTPLFQQNGIEGSLSGLAGNHNTWSDEVVLGALADRAAINVGQFLYRTDGGSMNGELDVDIVDGLYQLALSDAASIQVEGRYRDSSSTDRDESLFPDDVSRNTRINQQVLRIGSWIELSDSMTLLLNGFYTERSFHQDNSVPGPGGRDDKTRTNSTGLQSEALLLQRTPWANLQLGVGTYHLERNRRNQRFFDDGSRSERNKSEDDTDGLSLMAEGQVPITPTLSVVGRITYEWLTSKTSGDHDTVDPVIGVAWTPTPTWTTRASVGRSLKRPVALNATLLPTQTVGLVDLYDEADGTHADQIAAATSWRVTQDFAVGAEGAYRKLSSKLAGVPTQQTTDGREQLGRLYADWTITDEWVVSIAGELTRYRAEAKDSARSPTRYSRIAFPLSIRYFHPSGFYAAGAAELVRQHAANVEDIESGTTTDSVNDTQVIVDASLGWRLRHGRGTVALVVSNILDENSLAQSDDFRSSESGDVLLEGRSFMVRAQFNF